MADSASNDIEVIAIDDEDVSVVPELPVAKEGETIDWEAQAKTYQGMATRRGTKLSKLKNAKPAKPAEGEPPKQEPKKEFDYAEKAFLNTKGYGHDEDVKFIWSAVQSTGRTLDEVLADQFVAGSLKTMQEERTTKEGMPGADGRGGGAARDSVEYWLDKGGLPPPDQVELRRKVVDARAKRSSSGSEFTSEAVVGA